MIKAVDSLRGALIMKNEVMGGSRMTGFIFNIRMKCFLAAFAGALVVSLAACGDATLDANFVPENVDVIMVTDERGLGDMAFNDECWEGCERAADEFGINVYCIEPESSEMYASKINEAVGMEPKLIICSGADMEYALMDIAAQNPEMKFAIMDTNEIGDNVAGITFRDQDGAFLAGIAAAMSTESKIVSFIGGEQSVVADAFQYGFSAGVATVASDIYINTQYVGSTTDTDAARMLARAHEALGSDVIFQAAGAAGIAVIEAVQGYEGVMVIGTDIDQSYIAKDTVLCSVVKKADVAVFDVISKMVNGTFDGSDTVYTLADGAVGISDNAGNLSEDAQTAIEEYTAKITGGEIVVPYDWQSWYDYTQALSSGGAGVTVDEGTAGDADEI